MGALLSTRLGRRLFWVIGTVVAVGVALEIGRIVPGRPVIAVGVVAIVLALGLTAADASLIPLMTMPLVLVGLRIGGSGLDLSVSDATLGVATVVALIFAPRPFSPALRNLLWLSAIYQFATLFTVVANPARSGVIEWFHAWMLVAGALIVGWTVGRSGHARAGLSLILLVALVFAVGTILQGARHYFSGDFAPVYPTWPFSMHKNLAGNIFALAAIVAYARPVWLGWRKLWSLTAFGVLVVALLMTQSRQAVVGLAVALIFIVLRGDPHRRRSKVILALAIPGLFVVATTVRDQVLSGNTFNSTFVRLTWFQETLDYWATSPWIGHGLRYWYRPGEPTFQPPNAEMEVIAQAGVVGLIAFVALMIGALVILWRLNPAFGTLAVAVLVLRLVAGQLDLFWVAVQVSVPFVVIGVCLGALSWTEAETTPGGVASAEQEHARI